MLTLFHRRAPYAVTGIILLLLLTFAKVVNGNCWEKKFLYKLPHSKSCGLCRLCPQYVLDNPEENSQHIQEKCLHNKALQDGRRAHCHTREFEPPTCKNLTPDVGIFECTNTNVVYSSCHLVCPQGHSTVRSGNITCTASLQWDKPLPSCVSERRLNKHKHLNGGAIVCIVIISVSVVGGIAVVIIKKFGKHPCQEDIEYGLTPDRQLGLVSLMLTHGQLIDNQKQTWTVVKGCILKIEARCQRSKVVYLVLLKSGFTHRKAYTNKPDEPNQIILQNIRNRHSGKYNWIVGLEDGNKETGSFELKLVKYNINLKEPSLSRDEKTSLTDTDNEDEGRETVTACEDSDDLTNTMPENQLTETDQVHSGCSGAGFARLMKSRNDVNRLCTLFDREHKDGMISWHHIALSDLLAFDEDFVTFLEYHLKGQLYQGPMWYILNLMRQRGVSLQGFVEYLQQHQHGSNTAVELLKQYL